MEKQQAKNPNGKYKEQRFVVQISKELKEILDQIRDNVEYNTWGAEAELSYFKASKILAARVKKAGVYN